MPHPGTREDDLVMNKYMNSNVLDSVADGIQCFEVQGHALWQEEHRLYSYSMNGQLLEETDSEKDLGVVFSDRIVLAVDRRSTDKDRIYC